ncbi:MAG: hypothetical protein WC676_04890 [Candidatus Omnitrophota bacterium]
MQKSIFSTSFLFVMACVFFVFLTYSFAGLIDYERLRRLREKGQTLTPQQEKEMYPSWVVGEPRVKDVAERRYDINRDGLLQSAETKTFLRDVLDEVESKNGYLVNSDILKEYDKNKDGIINRFESETIRQQVTR